LQLCRTAQCLHPFGGVFPIDSPRQIRLFISTILCPEVCRSKRTIQKGTDTGLEIRGGAGRPSILQNHSWTIKTKGHLSGFANAVTKFTALSTKRNEKNAVACRTLLKQRKLE
jgi:hypothetical protein